MNDEPTRGVPNIDNLTPFEYALAGVPVPDGQDSPSLGVVKEMRRLAAEVEDAPVTHRGLRDFVQNGGPMAKRGDRRSMRSRKPSRAAGGARSRPAPVEGGFIDITPIEIVGETTPQPASVDADQSGPAFDVPAAAPGVAAGAADAAFIGELEDTVPPMSADELPVIEEDDVDVAGLPGDEMAQPVAGTGLQPPSPVAFSDDLGRHAVGDLVSPNGPESPDEVAPEFELTRIAPPTSDENSLVLQDGTEVPPTPERAPEEEFDDSVRTVFGDSVDGPDRMFPDVEDGPGFQTIGGPEPTAAELAAASPLFGDLDQNDDGAVLVAGGGAAVAGILEPRDEEEDSTATVSALAAPVPFQKRRLGAAAFWGLTGTVVASAALALGAMWWAGGLGDRTETESADQALTTTTMIDDTATEESPATLDMSEDGSDAEGDESGQGSGDFGDLDGSPSTGGSATTGPNQASTTQSPRSTSPGGQNNQSGSSVPATDGNSSTSDPTVPETTVPPATTEPTTATTRAPSTAAPTTRPPATTTETTAAPLAFIGDSVNIGGYSGPPASGARVSLYEDPDRDGQPDDLSQTQNTDGSGRFAFNVPADCYVVRFHPIENHRVDPALEYQPICVNPGEAAARVDGILYPIVTRSDPPSGCFVEPTSYGEVAGVEVYEDNQDWADSYTFYNRNGGVVVRTADLGPPDDIDNPNDHEWEAAASGFDHRAVWRVAAERSGVLSEQITCGRAN